VYLGTIGRLLAGLCLSLCWVGRLSESVRAAESEGLTLLSTQLRPIAEAQKMRNSILKDFPHEVDFVTELPQQLRARVETEHHGRLHEVDVIGALHGELHGLVPLDAFVPLDNLADRLTGRGVPSRLMAFGRLGTVHQLYIPWMQASYLMVANKAALRYLPAGADINALTYEELAIWAATIHDNTGKRMLGFPAGPQGLIHRFFEGYLLPSYTGGVVVPFRSAAAEAMWAQFASLWESVNPHSTGYDFMAQPLLAGDVWIGFDHVARLLEALRQKPDDFVAIPAPAGPRGRGYMPVLVGLAVRRGTPVQTTAMALLDYLTQPQTQIATARGVGFFPVAKTELPPDVDPGVRSAAAAIEKMQTAADALPALLPTGLGPHGGDFDRVIMETFRQIVLHGQRARPVLDREAAALQRLMMETGAPCWEPDPPSIGACQVQ
jgi:multiple sugar transport system substrate-binding protein